jgi:hypothetical protein
VETDSKIYRKQIVDIADLLNGTYDVLDGLTFIDCDIKGPAVLLLQDVTINHGNFAEDMNAILWDISPSRPVVAGAVLVRNCTFERCLFVNVGFAGPPEFIEAMRQGISTGLNLPQVPLSSEGAPSSEDSPSP